MTTLGGSAFQNCSTLAGSVNLQYVTSIGGSAFQSCSKITGVTFSSNLTAIGTWAFAGRTGLNVAISVPASVETVGRCAFRDTKITSLTFLGDSTVITPGNWDSIYNRGYRTVR